MRFSVIFPAAVLLCTAVPSHAAKVHRGPTSGKHKPANTTTQKAMDDARATEIQTALVKSGYLPSTTGHWDAASQAAMEKLQGDNGWQTKIVPDSRALIKLGLGPKTEASAAPMPAPGTAADTREPEELGGK